MDRSDLDGALLERLGGTFLFRATPPGLMEAVLLDRAVLPGAGAQGPHHLHPRGFPPLPGAAGVRSGAGQQGKSDRQRAGAGELFGRPPCSTTRRRTSPPSPPARTATWSFSPSPWWRT